MARAGVDYHVEYDGYFYSVPHSLIREQVDLRATSRTIEVFHRGQRVAAHQRRHGGRRHGTNPDHMPSSHRRYADWSPEARLRPIQVQHVRAEVSVAAKSISAVSGMDVAGRYQSLKVAIESGVVAVSTVPVIGTTVIYNRCR